MAYKMWRGVVGIIKPTMRPGGLEDMIRLLPDGIGVIPLYNDIRRGTRDEFDEVMADYDEKVARLADQPRSKSLRRDLVDVTARDREARAVE